MAAETAVAVLKSLHALQAGIQSVRDAVTLYREWKAAKGSAPEALGQKLEQAAQQLNLAEVEAAGKLGYHLCRRHWPPGIKIDESYRDPEGAHIFRRRCTSCEYVWEHRPAPEAPVRKRI